MRLTHYPSGGNELKAWHLAPGHDQLWTAEGYPAVVYVHDGTSFSEEELAQARLFSEAGFAVFAPAFRGENGNPGVHELLYGELDDLVAATKYVSELPHVDERRIAIWGHGLGGMLSALASLVPKLGVHYTGSSAGLRPTSAFEVLQKPFEDTAQERSLRLFGPNIQHMRSPHWACVAEEDLAVDSEAAGLGEMAIELQVPLHVERVAGNRASSRATCTQHAVVFLSKSFAARTWIATQ
jgi:dienelactone hydrolase